MKIAISSAIDKLGMFGILRRAMSAQSGLILALHRVLPPDERNLCYDPHLVLSEPAFVSLLRLLRQEYQVVHLEELLADPRGTGGRPKVALTFDDGWEDNYRIAFPHLMAYDMPATIYACAELMESSGALPEERFARLWRQCSSSSQLAELTADLNHWGIGRRKYPYRITQRRYWAQELKRMPLSARLLLLDHFERRYEVTPMQAERFLHWNDLRVMMQTGLVRVGSHTCRHASLSAENARDIRRELEDSRIILWNQTGVLPTTLAYPNGMYNRQVIELVRATGFQAALATQPGLATRRSHRFSMPRIAIDDTTVTNTDVQLSASRTSAYFATSWLRSAVC